MGSAAGIFVRARGNERVGLVYRVNLDFASLPSDLTDEDIAFDLTVAGQAF